MAAEKGGRNGVRGKQENPKAPRDGPPLAKKKVCCREGGEKGK